MKKEMSSFDVRSIVTEMTSLTNAHMDKVFQWGNNVLFRVNVQGQGKKELFFKDKKWLFLPTNKPETPILSQSFATFLRKYIDNARIGKIYQTGFDRVIVMEILKAEAEYDLIFEMFGGGNILLVLDGKILNCLIQKTMKDRSVRPGETYVMPKSRFDPTTSSFEDFVFIVKNSASDLVRTLATGANLGGQYAEEICKRALIDKNTKPGELSDDDIKKLYDKMEELVTCMLNSPEPTLYSNGNEIVDVAPVNLTIYDSYTSEKFDTMSGAFDRLMSSLKETEEEEYTDPEMEKLQRRVDRQIETIEEYRTEAEDLRKRADLIYANYQQINELLTVLSEQSKKITWDKLAEGAVKIPYVSSIDPSKNMVTTLFDKLSVTLDYTKNIDANASAIYQQGKDLNEKALRADEALKDSKEALEKKRKGFIKAKVELSNKVQPTKQFWFERYKWFITTSGKMVIAGRDAHTNDNIVKKHLKDEDVYAHADVHGAPSTILKEGRDATPDDVRETCLFALVQSKAWVAALSDGSAYWVYTDQVSKTPQAGEYIPRGAFIIRGKRNYEHHLPMELAIGEISYQNARKVMCGPTESVAKLSTKYFVIHPGRGKATKTTALMAKELQVPEEEVARILPPGDAEIVKKVWPIETAEE